MTLKLGQIVASTAIFVMMSGVSHATTYTIDQRNDDLSPNQGYTTLATVMGQSFSPTFNWLDHVELQINSQGGTATAHVDIMDSPTGSILGSSNSLTFTSTAIELAHFEFSPIDISSYSTLFISVVKDSTSNVGAFLAGGFGIDNYAGGSAYSIGAPCCDGFQLDSDLWFRTGAAVVPVPAAAWLFGSGLIGLVGLARRKA